MWGNLPYFDSLKSAMMVLLASAEETESAKTKDTTKKDLMVSSVLENPNNKWFDTVKMHSFIPYLSGKLFVRGARSYLKWFFFQ